MHSVKNRHSYQSTRSLMTCMNFRNTVFQSNGMSQIGRILLPRSRHQPCEIERSKLSMASSVRSTPQQIVQTHHDLNSSTFHSPTPQKETASRIILSTINGKKGERWENPQYQTQPPKTQHQTPPHPHPPSHSNKKHRVDWQKWSIHSPSSPKAHRR